MYMEHRRSGERDARDGRNGREKGQILKSVEIIGELKMKTEESNR